MADLTDLEARAAIFRIQSRRIRRRARKLGRWLPGLIKRLDEARAKIEAQP